MASVIEHNPVGTQTTSANISRSYRIERYVEIGFDDDAAGRLADAWQHETLIDRHGKKRVWPTPLYWGRVARALAHGCTHEQAVAIFL